MRKKIGMSRDENLSASEAYERFVRRCRVRNLSGKTLAYYHDYLRPFFEFIGEDSPISTIHESTVDEYTLHLREKDSINETTVNSHIRALRAFLYFLMDKGLVERFKVNLIKATKKLKETYTDEEISTLLRKPDMKECTFTEYKCWVFENYLLGTGNRISTALNVRIRDIDFDNGLIALTKTKNRRQQLIPLSDTLSSILREFLERRGGTSDDYLFCNIYGEKGHISTFQQMVARYNRSRGVSKTSCHLFRHSFAKIWILNGGDIVRLMKILGHSDLSVTKEYLNMFSDDLQKGFDQFDPLSKFSQNKRRRL